ncbi:hypothetical protein F443_03144 [Phytophthora nicotianae P1569]|uniref:Uncharacterized protein n=1 Tax=Phytophthora nicotianae P1569 TaxID=1317065 RepID=V9FSD0_PHYNI|nr:hypothetical protein F443_03144 [Phytophthora nicotianae P1569]
MVRVQFGAERSRSSGPGACDRGPGEQHEVEVAPCGYFFERAR